MGWETRETPLLRWSFAVLAIAGAQSVACYSPAPRTGAPCVSDVRCPTGQACIEGFCGGPGDVADADVDAPSPDTPPPDAPVDAPPRCLLDQDCVASPCQTFACIANECVATARPDGTACGGAAANRCCNGACVDISEDEANCGGCGQTCAAGGSCESIAVTTACPQAPVATSGRCTCDANDDDCPDGQICRNLTPYADRCAPSSVANCAPGETMVDIVGCPNFCRYP